MRAWLFRLFIGWWVIAMVMCIKKNSLKVSSDTISFETVTEPKVVVA